jgi:hypothetical protein
MPTAANAPRAIPALSAWQWGFLLLAVLTLLPVAYFTYQDTQEAGRAQRVQLIERYRLWETAPEYRGTPQSWTRFAAWLLDTDQLLERVRIQQGALAEQIEQDYRRDLVLVYGRIAGGYLLLWMVPLALLYGMGFLYQRRRQR